MWHILSHRHHLQNFYNIFQSFNCITICDVFKNIYFPAIARMYDNIIYLLNLRKFEPRKLSCFDPENRFPKLPSPISVKNLF